MFKQARIKLTARYLLIIMIISLSFSVIIYRTLTFELNRVERMHRLRIERLPIDPNLISETKKRLLTDLILVNLTILLGSAAAGYFLAGQTLKPISQMLEEQTRFAADASHELRTPLTSLKSEIEVNLRNKKLTLGEAKKLLGSNLEEVNNLQALSDRLIKSTQYQRGGNGLEMTKIPLAFIVNKAIKVVANLAKNQDIKIVKKIKNCTLMGNETALVEMLVIFLDNAIKYSPKQTKVRLISKKTDSSVLIQITDQGMGIDKKDIPHVFDRFYRADKSRTKSEVPGYGLGLSIAKQIVDRHHGSIKVRSLPNKGTIFTIQLPCFSAISQNSIVN